MSAKDIERLATVLADSLVVANHTEERPEGTAVSFNMNEGVRAILQAMREPTAEMSCAGYTAGEFEVSAGYSYSEHTSDPACLSDDAPNVIWQAMIDHLLAD